MTLTFFICRRFRSISVIYDSQAPVCVSYIDEYDARKLNWMPKELPPHVKVVFSCLPDEKFKVVESFDKIWGKYEDHMVAIGPLPVSIA